MTVKAILFDKDGTLFDFAATWSDWAARILRQLSGGDTGREAAMAEAIRFDLATRKFHSESVAIGGTNLEVAEALAAHVPGQSATEIERQLAHGASQAELAEAVPLAAFLDGLAGRGLSLGVMTNDAESSAHNHLQRAGILEKFDFVAGFDSGYGVKPDPDPLLAFCRAVSVAPGQAAMVGDSLHDLVAGRAAGMQTLGVLTGLAEAAELAPYADVVLPHIGHIPDWLDG